jgi:putative transcriptional regulator
MTIRHHPREETLMAFAAGTLMPALAATVACHLALCPRCRAEVRHMERIGGALLRRVAAEAISNERLNKLLAQTPAIALDPRVAVGAQGQPEDDGVMPRPLARHLGMNMDEVPWKSVVPGIDQFKVRFRRGEGDFRLVRVQPGLKLLRHGHYGTELTLVLKGAYTDETGEYHVGDIADHDEDIEHRPHVTKDGECISIIAGETHPRYKSLKVRLLRPFLGL